ncbi:hypothetical protein WICPIJ_008423 [Wickerhamomyces pijperi]|uniref:Uncharacterized protein n=1 Tax=Wickerhamomyces pijperi TaxID=599730 RepID=A0A9P8PWZ5_WICPI|nr:hypothetical protein WICPIJ_008423 [Wickerhamomyces pijperi]
MDEYGCVICIVVESTASGLGEGGLFSEDPTKNQTLVEPHFSTKTQKQLVSEYYLSPELLFMIQRKYTQLVIEIHDYKRSPEGSKTFFRIPPEIRENFGLILTDYLQTYLEFLNPLTESDDQYSYVNLKVLRFHKFY